MAGLHDQQCDFERAHAHLAFAVRRRWHLHRTLGVGSQSHSDHGQRPHPHHTLEVQTAHLLLTGHILQT